MRAGIVGIAVIVVAIGLIWSVAVMSELVPVDRSAMTSIVTPPHVAAQAAVDPLSITHAFPASARH